MNEKLTCTAVYEVFALYMAGGHGILDIQQNSSCDPCPSHPCLISTSNPRSTKNPVGNELPKLEIGLA